MDAGKVKQLLEAGVHYVIRFEMPEHVRSSFTTLFAEKSISTAPV